MTLLSRVTSVDLKKLLTSVVDSLNNLKTVLPPNVDAQLVTLLEHLQKDQVTLDLFSDFLHLIVPTLTKDDLVKDVQALISQFTVIEDLITSGQLDKVIEFCSRLRDRPFVLAVLSKLL